MKTKFIINLFIFCLPIITFAAQPTSTTNLPVRCQSSNYHFQNNKLILSVLDAKQHLYLLSNQSAQAFYVNHQKIPAGASAGWMSQLDPQHWSAIATKQKNFAITCGSMQSGYFTEQPCQNLLTVCFMPQTLFPQNLRNAGFWVAENQNNDKIISAIKERRIKILE
jgi:hypothetical protein